MKADAERMAEERARELEAQKAEETKSDAGDGETKADESEDK